MDTASVDNPSSSGKLFSSRSAYLCAYDVLQTKVALDRIATYLDEDEVTDQVSTLKKSRVTPEDSANDDDLLGIDNGSFKWNEVEEENKDDKAKGKKDRVSSEDTIAASENGSDSDGESADHRFELKDISVKFPDGKLTCVTGPTASGKTALLVRTFHLL